HHRRAVQGHELVVALRIEYVGIEPGQLQPDEHRQQSADQHESEAGDDEAQPDGAVVDRGQLAAQARPVAPYPVQRPEALRVPGRLPRVRAHSRPPAVSPTAFSRSQPAYCSGPSTVTSNAISACSRPQNSAHWPRMGPAWSARSRSTLVRPGIASILPPRRGTQKLWMTSLLSTWNSTISPSGITSWSTEAAIVAPSASRYSNSHCHWR